MMGMVLRLSLGSLLHRIFSGKRLSQGPDDRIKDGFGSFGVFVNVTRKELVVYIDHDGSVLFLERNFVRAGGKTLNKNQYQENGGRVCEFHKEVRY